MIWRRWARPRPRVDARLAQRCLSVSRASESTSPALAGQLGTAGGSFAKPTRRSLASPGSVRPRVCRRCSGCCQWPSVGDSAVTGTKLTFAATASATRECAANVKVTSLDGYVPGDCRSKSPSPPASPTRRGPAHPGTCGAVLPTDLLQWWWQKGHGTHGPALVGVGGTGLHLCL